jgi:hypothetical protein
VGEVGFSNLVRQLLDVVGGEFGINARLARAHEFAREIAAVNHALTFPNGALIA